MRRPEKRALTLRLLCGLVLYVVCAYAAPRRCWEKAKAGAMGLYPELGLLGFLGGHSPALVETVARAAALYPSFELARRELKHRGIAMSIKGVYGITHRLGSQFLRKRTELIQAWRAGELPSTGDLAGKRIGVALDGGRVRLREKRRRQVGRGKAKKRRRRYQAQWREPKLLVIFELDEQGRMKEGTQAVIDGTLQGPDELMELLAMHLHRLGAQQAQEVVFLADGAPWIWNRLAWVEKAVGLDPQRVHHVLDWCHAVHHVSLAVAQIKLPEQSRTRIFRRLRNHLRGGRIDLVIRELGDRAQGQSQDAEIGRVLAYLETHRAHMDYKKLREQGRPMGSGAIESAVRRVINQRLKGNGTIWLQDQAEGMLVMRAALLSGRWDQDLDAVCALMTTSRKVNWHWSSPDTAAPLNPGHSQPGPNAESLVNQEVMSDVA